MIKLLFNPTLRNENLEVDAEDPAHAIVSDLIGKELGRSARAARRFLAMVEGVRSGQLAPIAGTGEYYFYDIGAASTSVHTGLTDGVPSCEVPTDWFIDALKEWIAYVVEHYGDDAGRPFSDENGYAPPRGSPRVFAKKISMLAGLSVRETPGTHDHWRITEAIARLRKRAEVLDRHGTLEEAWGAPLEAARPEL